MLLCGLKKSNISLCQWVHAPLTIFLAAIKKVESWGQRKMSGEPGLLNFVNHKACLQMQSTAADLVVGLETLLWGPLNRSRV